MGVPYLRLISPALKGGVLRRVRINVHIKKNYRKITKNITVTLDKDPIKIHKKYLPKRKKYAILLIVMGT